MTVPPRICLNCGSLWLSRLPSLSTDPRYQRPTLHSERFQAFCMVRRWRRQICSTQWQRSATA